MKCYVITEVDLDTFNESVVCVYTDKEKAKRKVDMLNDSHEEENNDFRIQTFETDED